MSSRRVIAIAGGSGAGKSTLAEALSAALGPSTVIVAQDDYYRDRSHLSEIQRSACNYDHPDSIEFDLLAGHIAALRAGSLVEAPVYDFSTHSRRRETRQIVPAPIVILEGMLVLHDERLRTLADLSVFVEESADLRLARRLTRDVTDRGRSMDGVISQYFDTVKPMHDRFVAPQRVHADLLVNSCDAATLRNSVALAAGRLGFDVRQDTARTVRGSPA